MKELKEVERSIHTTYSKTIWSRFVEGIKKYELIKPGDKICVCISGGKDSTLLAVCMRMLHKITDFPFEIKFLVMDPGYRKENRELIEKNLKTLEIDAYYFENSLFEAASKTCGEKNPCYMCSRMRRGNLYAKAKELGCNKIALGHHFDDMIETVLMSIIYGSQVRTMLPKLHSDNFEGMELIRPLFLVKEKDIIAWKEENEFKFLGCACPISEEGRSEESSKRKQIKQLIADLKKTNKQVDMNIFKSMYNIKLGAVIEYTDKEGNQHSFLDDYE